MSRDITTGMNFDFIQDKFIEAKTALKEEQKTGVVNSDRLKGIGLEGASRCFVKGTKVVTNEGVRAIEDVRAGNVVKTYNESNKVIEYKPVIAPHVFYDNKKRTIRIVLKCGGVIEGTEDHEIYFKGAWVTIKHLVSLLDERMEKNKRI